MTTMKSKLPKIAVLFSGAGSNLAYILEKMHGKELDVVLALSNKPDAGGVAIAKAYGVRVETVDSSLFESREAFDHLVVEKLEASQAELVVLAGFMRILTPVFTDRVRAINLHPSLLPRHKGLHAIEKSYGDEYPEGGVTIHWVNSELDGGKVILQKSISKEGLSFAEYDKMIRKIEKEALADGIRKALSLGVL